MHARPLRKGTLPSETKQMVERQADLLYMELAVFHGGRAESPPTTLVSRLGMQTFRTMEPVVFHGRRSWSPVSRLGRLTFCTMKLAAFHDTVLGRRRRL